MVNFPKRHLVIRSDSIVHKKRRSPVKKIAYFLIVGLAITALQATTVEAQGGDPNMPPPMGDMTGMPPMGDPNMPPPVPADPMGTSEPPVGDPNIPPPVPAER